MGELEAVLNSILGIFMILIVILAIGIFIIVVLSFMCLCCSCEGDDLLPTISDNTVNVPENPVGVTENPAAHRTQLQEDSLNVPENPVGVTENHAAHRTQLQQDSIRSPSVPTQPPGNPNRVAHFNLTTPVEETTETTRGIITSGPPRYPYSADEVPSWESPDISPPQDAPPPSYDDLFKS